MKHNWHIKQISQQVSKLTFNNLRSGDVRYALLMSDEHWDNKHSDHKTIHEHHTEAVIKDAPIFKFGDTLCLMQGKWDKRKSEEQIREEHRGSDYLNKVIRTANKFYKPYKEQIALITYGNHETAILKHHDFDVLQELTEKLDCKLGSYQGFVTFEFKFSSSNTSVALDLCYHHGYGGGGEVTRGLIDNSRTRGQYDADIFYSGHIHRKNQDINLMTRINNNGRVVKKEQLFLRGSCYKHECDGGNGWHIEGGRAARPLGGWWLQFTCRSNSAGERIVGVKAIAT